MAGEDSVAIGRPLYGGDFVAGSGALAFVLPGERVVAGDVVAPSPQRVAPGCVHFGVCGGCQYQHASYEAQVAIKTELLGGILSAAGLRELPEFRTHVAEPWGYRNRIRLRVEEVRGELCLGYSVRGSNAYLPVRMCPIAAPVLWKVAEALIACGRDHAALRRWLGRVQEVEFFCTADETRLQAHFFLREPPDGDQTTFDRLCAALQARVPQLGGAGAELHPERSRRARRAWDGVAWGAAGLQYEVSGRRYWVSRGAFFQVNRFLVERLVAIVTDGAAGELAWDLFAGVGLFSQVLAERFAEVVAVEGGAAAAAALSVAGRRAFRAVQAPAQQFLAGQELQRERPGLVVLDPPRAGLGTEGAATLARIAPAEVVYVSCDPVTLARDLGVLVRAGYRVQAVDLIDLFPQTFHLETVVRLVRSGPVPSGSD